MCQTMHGRQFIFLRSPLPVCPSASDEEGRATAFSALRDDADDHCAQVVSMMWAEALTGEASTTTGHWNAECCVASTHHVRGFLAIRRSVRKALLPLNNR